MKDFFGIDYNMLSTNIANSNKNTHRFIIDYIEDQINENIGFQESKNFKHKIKDLKVFREESDYEDIDITIEQGQKAYKIAEELRSYISKKFHV